MEAEALKASLRQRLPEYMVPGAVVVLEALPLNSNGKVDRKALPEPEAPKAGSTYEAPRTETEAKLAAIWAEVLRVPQVGVKDDFFALGGHSLLATQVVSRVRAETGAELPLRALFEAPTVEALARRLEKAGRAKAPALVPVSRDAPLPLSFAQQRLWFIDQLDPGTALYNIPVAIRLEGDWDAGALERALHEVVRRHEALRTTFVAGNPEPVQQIASDSAFTLEVDDLTANTAEVRRRVEQEVLRPFDLAQGPLIRALLLKLGAGEHVLTVTMHHIVSDGWSLGVLVREVGALYAAFVQGQPSPLPELPVQYADYAAWQRGWLQGATLQREVDYWKLKLAGAPPVLELPTDRPRPAVRGNAGATQGFLWPHSMVQGLRALAQREGASLYMVLLAGWQVLLSRYSGQTDISVGSPIAGRTRAEVEGLIGLFVNTLVLRAQVDGDQSFRALLKQVRGTVLGAYEHQDVPFEKLVEALQPERSLSHTPLFQSLLALQNTPEGEARLPGLTMKQLELENRTSKFDLSVFFTETAEGLSGSVEYSTDLFEAATVRRLVEHLRVLLEGVVAKPEEAVGRLPMLTEAERQQVLVTWNQQQAEYTRDATIPHLFEAQAKRTPDAVAVVSGKQRLTYREVEAKANQLAHRLRKLGVGPESRVGLCVERTADVVVGTLGILKAGGAYVPLDPSYPKERLGWLLEDAQGPALVAHSHLLESLPAFSAQAVCLDTDATLATEPSEPPEAGLRPENVAYLIYTSGSTGRPKGVAVTHRNAVAFLSWATETFTEEETKTVLAATSLNFDLSVFELFAPLVRGGSVVVVRNALHLAEEKPDAEVTLINTVPSAMAQLVRLNAVPPSVRVVNLAGEALPETLAKAVYAVPTVKKLYNLYGPSEDTTYSTWSLVGRNEVPNIGRPLTNTRAYVLDKYLQPVPVGVAGELFLAGEGQARGYLLRPELTAEKFLPEVYGPEGSRMYRTGDRVRYRADGVLEYLGRVDFQVKVRGFRIELGEVESALRQQETVKEAVVVAKGEGAEKRLVAYVAPKAGATLEAEALKASLRQRLPEYMVPGAVVVLEALPLNSNGKVDRKALPDPEAPVSTHEYEAPRTEMEAKLAAIWAEVLRVPRVGVKDDFFALGGHSLLATQVVSRVRAETGAELPLRALFEAPTVQALASRLEKTGRAKAPALVPVSRDAPLPLSFAQQRLWFIDQLEPGTALYNIPVAIRLEGDLYVQVLERALSEVVRRHEALRTMFVVGNPEPKQRTTSDSAFTLAVEDLTSDTAALQTRVEQEVSRPFELAHGPLLRALLLKLGAREHVLVVTMHHIVSDGWSLGVLVREVGALYAAFVQGQPSPLPELPVQYADYAAWQRGWLQGATLQREVDYWKLKLAGAPPVLELPTDRPRPAVRGNAGATQGFLWPQSMAQGLRALAQREGASLYMVLLAGWQVLLSRYSGQTDISVGSPIAGRTRAEVEGLIGFFVNTLVLRANLSGDPSFRGLLQQVRETVLDAQEHQEVPFEKLVEALQPERSRSHTPLFQTLLALQNVPIGQARLPGMTLKPVELAGGTSKFDLSVFFMETAEGLSGMLEYSTDLFEAATVRRMVEHLRVLLEGVLEHPEARVTRLPLLDDAERRQVVEDPNPTATRYPREVPVHAHFEAQARKTPDAVALKLGAGEGTLTYDELDAKANQLAHHLRSLGVKRGTRVGVYVERSFDMVVGLLAILKAGGAYAPVDRNYPVERIALMLEDAGVEVTLTQQSLVEKLPASAGRPLPLDTAWSEVAHQPRTAPRVEVSAEDLAYVMFTSGSTGRPKGVCVPHRGITRLVMGNDFLRFGPEEVWLQLAPVAFDASTLELWGALLHGAKLVLAPPHALTLEELGTLLKQERISVLWLTAALYEQMALHQVDALSGVAQVLAGGDVLPAQRVREHLKRLPQGAVLVNGYGPTENTTFSTTHTLTRDTSPTSSVPIGKPIGNSTAYVLDTHGDVAGVGVPGELYVGGEGLAWGYLNRADLTAERFVPNAFSMEPGARLYRTGDKARWKEDGTLEFLGRTDFQVKVRGFRIEPGEIEAALLRQQGVAEATVVVRDVGGDKRLVAYLVAKPGQNIDPKAVETELRKHLPEYMVPSAMGVLDALPLSANGKVDRKALPDLDVSTSQAEAFVAPRDALESQLVAVWEEVLGVKPIGVRTSFFALGGHSLLAVRLVAALREQLGRDVPLAALFQHPTVEELARLLRAGTETWSPLVPLEKGDAGRRPLFLVHPGGGNVLAYPELARLLGPQQPVFGIQARGLQAGHAVVETVEEMATLYVAAIRAEQPEGPYLLAGWSLGGVIAFEMARQLRAQGQAVGLLALVDAFVPGVGAPSGDAPRKDPDASTRVAFAQTVAQAFSLTLPVSDEALERMEDEAMLGTLLAMGIQAGLLEEATGREQLRALFRVYQANLRAMDRYVPSPYDGPALLLAATEATPTPGVPRHRGWEPFVRGGLDVRDVPGGHHQLMQEPYVRHVATLLREALEDKS
ncbi:amino acid adenylation domain-containing protein [Corallococcus sp. CA049B]|uniref:amino acid adenylation domain-containing protein n=1 Tax=Corallococcus sp. CA049B TaxID=2316730 RepID=UPI00351A46EA